LVALPVLRPSQAAAPSLPGLVARKLHVDLCFLRYIGQTQGGHNNLVKELSREIEKTGMHFGYIQLLIVRFSLYPILPYTLY
jgi:hypothetical protein